MLIQLEVTCHPSNCSIFILKLTPQSVSKIARIHASTFCAARCKSPVYYMSNRVTNTEIVVHEQRLVFVFYSTNAKNDSDDNDDNDGTL